MAHDDDTWLALFEVLIPADADRGIPSAAIATMVPRVQERLRAMPGMLEAAEACLGELLDRSPGVFSELDLMDRSALVEALDAESPGRFGALAFNLYAVYYHQPEVLGALGLPARPPFPEGFVIEGDDEAWFEKARARAQRG